MTGKLKLYAEMAKQLFLRPRPALNTLLEIELLRRFIMALPEGSYVVLLGIRRGMYGGSPDYTFASMVGALMLESGVIRRFNRKDRPSNETPV